MFDHYVARLAAAHGNYRTALPAELFAADTNRVSLNAPPHGRSTARHGGTIQLVRQRAEDVTPPRRSSRTHRHGRPASCGISAPARVLRMKRVPFRAGRPECEMKSGCYAGGAWVHSGQCPVGRRRPDTGSTARDRFPSAGQAPASGLRRSAPPPAGHVPGGYQPASGSQPPPVPAAANRSGGSWPNGNRTWPPGCDYARHDVRRASPGTTSIPRRYCRDPDFTGRGSVRPVGHDCVTRPLSGPDTSFPAGLPGLPSGLSRCITGGFTRLRDG
jgi:hypothetical protein